MNTGERRLTTVAAIFASVSLLAAGSAVQTTAVTLRAGLEGFGDLAIGVVSAGYYLGVLGGSFLALLVISNVGYVRAFAAFASLASASSLAHVLWIAPVPWFVFRVVHGVCLSVVLVVVESWLNASAPHQRRGEILSLYGVIYLAATGLGQPLISVFPPATFQLFAATSILISLCLLPVSLALVTGSPNVGRLSIRVVGIFRKSPMGSSGVIVAGLITGAHLSLAPRFAQNLGLGDAAIGTFLLTFALGTIVMQVPIGILSDRSGRRAALLLSSGLGLAASLALSVSTESGPFLSGAALVFGGAALPIYSLAIATVNDQLVAEEMVEASSALYVMYGLGSVSGPLLAAAVMGRMGVGALYLTIGVVLGAYIAFGLVRIRRVPIFQVRGRAARYRTIPRTTLVAYEMLKRRPRRPRRKRQTHPTAFDGYSSYPGERAPVEQSTDSYTPESRKYPPGEDS